MEYKLSRDVHFNLVQSTIINLESHKGSMYQYTQVMYRAIKTEHFIRLHGYSHITKNHLVVVSLSRLMEICTAKYQERFIFRRSNNSS